jgi:hypothetical protein
MYCWLLGSVAWLFLWLCSAAVLSGMLCWQQHWATTYLAALLLLLLLALIRHQRAQV